MSATVTKIQADTTYTLPLRAVSTKEYLNSIKDLFDGEMQEAVEQAMNQTDEKIALVGVLLHVIRPQMEEREELFAFEEELLERINDPRFVEEMEQLDSDRKLIEAMAKGSKAGLLAGRKALATSATDLVSKMDQSLKGLKKEVAEFHETRRDAIKQTTARIMHLSGEEARLLSHAKKAADSSIRAGDQLVTLQSRVKESLDKVDELMWKV